MSKKTATGVRSGRPRSFSEPETGLPPENNNVIPEPFNPLGVDGRRYWDTIWKYSGHLDADVDTLLVEDLCQAVDELHEMRRALSTGMVSRTQKVSNGTIIVHPFVNQIKEYRAQINSWMAALGFGPAERMRLGIGQKAEDLVTVMKSLEESLLASQIGGDDD